MNAIDLTSCPDCHLIYNLTTMYKDGDAKITRDRNGFITSIIYQCVGCHHRFEAIHKILGVYIKD
jgi:hypothetical protein